MLWLHWVDVGSRGGAAALLRRLLLFLSKELSCVHVFGSCACAVHVDTQQRNTEQPASTRCLRRSRLKLLFVHVHHGGPPVVDEPERGRICHLTSQRAYTGFPLLFTNCLVTKSKAPRDWHTLDADLESGYCSMHSKANQIQTPIYASSFILHLPSTTHPSIPPSLNPLGPELRVTGSFADYSS